MFIYTYINKQAIYLSICIQYAEDALNIIDREFLCFDLFNQGP